MEKGIHENKSSKIKKRKMNKDKTKVKYLLKGKYKWNRGERAQYMETLSRKEFSAIFAARTIMIKFKGNYHNIK